MQTETNFPSLERQNSEYQKNTINHVEIPAWCGSKTEREVEALLKKTGEAFKYAFTEFPLKILEQQGSKALNFCYLDSNQEFKRKICLVSGSGIVSYPSAVAAQSDKIQSIVEKMLQPNEQFSQHRPRSLEKKHDVAAENVQQAIKQQQYAAPKIPGWKGFINKETVEQVLQNSEKTFSFACTNYSLPPLEKNGSHAVRLSYLDPDRKVQHKIFFVSTKSGEITHTNYCGGITYSAIDVIKRLMHADEHPELTPTPLEQKTTIPSKRCNENIITPTRKAPRVF